MRSRSPLPQCCAAKIETPVASPVSATIRTAVSLELMPTVATAVVPSWPTMSWSVTSSSDSTALCAVTETAMAQVGDVEDGAVRMLIRESHVTPLFH